MNTAKVKKVDFSKSKILNRTQVLKKLSPRIQTKYLLKKAELAVQLTQFSSLELSFKNAKRKRSRKKTALLWDLFLLEAKAVSVGDMCSIAGHISRVKEAKSGRLYCSYSGDYCSINGKKGFSCNPQIFQNSLDGNVHCVPRNGGDVGVTKSCLNKMKETVSDFNEVMRPSLDLQTRNSYSVNFFGKEDPDTDQSNRFLQSKVNEVEQGCNLYIFDKIPNFSSEQCTSDIRKKPGNYYKAQACNCFDIKESLEVLKTIKKKEVPPAEEIAQPVKPRVQQKAVGPLSCIEEGFRKSNVNISKPYLRMLGASIQTHGQQKHRNIENTDSTGQKVFAGAYPFKVDATKEEIRIESPTVRPFFCEDKKEANPQTPRQAFLRSMIEHLDSKGWCEQNTWPRLKTSGDDSRWLEEVLHGQVKVQKRKYENEKTTSGATRFKNIFNVNINNGFYVNAFTGSLRKKSEKVNIAQKMRNWNFINQKKRQSFWSGFLVKNGVRSAASGQAKKCIQESQNLIRNFSFKLRVEYGFVF